MLICFQFFNTDLNKPSLLENLIFFSCSEITLTTMKINAVFTRVLFLSSFWRKMNRRRKRNIALKIPAILIADLIFPSKMEDIERGNKKRFLLRYSNERVLKYIS